MKDPAVLLYIDKYLNATKLMIPEARAWFLDLLLHQYDTGSVPNDMDDISVICRIKPSEYERFEHVFEQVLKHKFEQNENGALENPFASEILQKRKSFKEKRSLAGTVSYVVRFAKDKMKLKKNDIKYLKDNMNFENLDTSEHVLKQMIEQVFEQKNELYINEDEDEVKDKVINVINWRKDFKVYQAYCEDGMNTIFCDKQTISELQKMHPEIDIIKTINKSFREYWNTIKGWNKKKSDKSKKTIDWKKTFINACGFPFNQVKIGESDDPKVERTELTNKLKKLIGHESGTTSEEQKKIREKYFEDVGQVITDKLSYFCKQSELRDLRKFVQWVERYKK
jgi:hypothetical protein